MNNFGIWKKGGWIQNSERKNLRFDTAELANETAKTTGGEAGRFLIVENSPMDLGPQWTPAQVANYKARFLK